MKTLLTAVLALAFISGSAFAAPKRAKKSVAKPATPAASATKVPAPSSTNAGDDVVVGSSTRIDFSDTAIDGRMKAPEGFFLQGHNANSLSQLVKLRSNFRSELRNSRSAVKSHVK